MFEKYKVTEPAGDSITGPELNRIVEKTTNKELSKLVMDINSFLDGVERWLDKQEQRQAEKTMKDYENELLRWLAPGGNGIANKSTRQDGTGNGNDFTAWLSRAA